MVVGTQVGLVLWASTTHSPALGSYGSHHLLVAVSDSSRQPLAMVLLWNGPGVLGLWLLQQLVLELVLGCHEPWLSQFLILVLHRLLSPTPLLSTFVALKDFSHPFATAGAAGFTATVAAPPLPLYPFPVFSTVCSTNDKDESSQEKKTWEKSLNGPNIAKPGGSTGLRLPPKSKSEPNGLIT
jgi:hypothetical protein